MMIRGDLKLQKLHEDFKKFYDKKLLEDYVKLEDKRRKNLKSFLFRFVPFCIVFYLLCKIFILTYKDVVNLFLLSIIPLYYVFWPLLEFEADTKNVVMDKILSFFGSFKFGINRISDKDIKKSELFANFSYSSNCDEFCGSYNGVNISVSETKIYKQGVRSSRIIFNGLLIMLDFDRKFKGKTVLISKCSLKFELIILFIYLLGLSGYTYLSMQGAPSLMFVWVLVFNHFIFFAWYIVTRVKNRSKREVINLEDVVFAKKWKVYAKDQVEARYVLTTAFMERILEVKRRFKGKDIEFSFFGNKLFIAIHTSKDMFETTSLFRSALKYDRIQNVVNQFYSIFSIIDLLKIDGNKKDESK